MKNFAIFNDGTKRLVRPLLLTALAFVAQVTSSSAQTTTLNALNSSVTVNNTGASAGVVDWTVDGVNLLDPSQSGQQWFYYSVGGNPVTGIQNIGTASVSTPSQPGPGTASFATTYSSTSYNVSVAYTLSGNTPGSGASGLQESVTIHNNTVSPLVFHFYEFSEFTVNTPQVALGRNFNNTTFNEGAVFSGNILLQQVVDANLSPGAPLGQLNVPLATLLGGPGAYVLTASPGAGPQGPVAGNIYALEWDLTIGAGLGTTIVGGNTASGITPVPEPAAWSLVSLGLIAFGAARRFRRSAKQ